MNFICLSMSVLAASMFVDAIVSVLSIIGIVVAGGFLLFFIGDLMLAILDPDNSRAARRKREKEEDRKASMYDRHIEEEKNYNYVPTQQVEVKKEPEVKQPTEVDEEKAKLEQQLLNNNVNDSFARLRAEEEAFRLEKEKFFAEKMAKEKQEESKLESEEEDEDLEDFNLDDIFFDDDDKKEEDNKEEVVNEENEQPFNNNYFFSPFDELENKEETEENEDETSLFDFSTEEKDEPVKDEEENSDNAEDEIVVSEQLEEEPEVEKVNEEESGEVEQEESDEVEQEEIEVEQEDERNQEIEELRKQLEENKAKLMEIETQKKNLMEQLEKSNEEIEMHPLGSLSQYENRLETLQARLKTIEKEYKVNKKEFLPLQKIKKSLDTDKTKLRKREALVAKQKVLLYGVNNIADIDETKAKKLAEDLDLLDGLRLSVQHCEEVMKNNAERYPILERTHQVLKTTIDGLKQDIAETEKAIEEIKADSDK